MTLRVGTDLTVVARLEHLIEAVGEPFLTRTFTAGELRDCAGAAQSLAARWAAKESVLKALGVGVDALPLTDIEVLPGPGLRLHGAAARRAAALGLDEWALSLSHDGGLALAFVVARASTGS